MKKTAMTLLVAAGLMISSMAVHPQTAHADAFGHTICAIFTLGMTDCEPFSGSDLPGPVTLTFSLENAAVTATNDKHTYAFDMAPSDGTAAQHYTGTYTVSSKVAHEDYGKAHWDFTCPFDPWSYAGTLVCTQPASLAGSSLAEPAGAVAADDAGRAILAAALAKVEPKSPTVSTRVSSSNYLLIAAEGSTSSKPDLEAVQIAGPTTVSNGDNPVYKATIRNNGTAANGNVEVVIGMSGALGAWDPIVQSIGLSCTQGTGQNVNTWTCEGGTLAAGQSATLQFRAHAAGAGQGTIVVSLNSSRALDESDYSNDIAISTVTVTK